MPNLLINELKPIAKCRITKAYKSIPKDRLLSALIESKIKEIEKILFELEKSLSKIKNYYDYDYIEHKEIRHMRNLFDLPIDVGYYSPIITNSNYTEYESKGEKPKISSIKKYLRMIRPYFGDAINNKVIDSAIINYKTQGGWKIQLSMTINFISTKDSGNIRTINTKGHNIEITVGNETEETIEELFKSLLQRYQEGLKKSVRGRVFGFHSVDLLYYKLPKIGLNRGRSNVDSPKWFNIKRQQSIKKNDDKCFQYVVTATLNYQNNPQKILKVKRFINQYN